MHNADDRFLQDARQLFDAFYAVATLDDRTWFDALIRAHVALSRGTTIPREVLSDAERSRLERACDKAERKFMEARDQVRACATFRKLVPGDRRRIESVLFDLYPPTA